MKVHGHRGKVSGQGNDKSTKKLKSYTIGFFVVPFEGLKGKSDLIKMFYAWDYTEKTKNHEK